MKEYITFTFNETLACAKWFHVMNPGKSMGSLITVLAVLYESTASLNFTRTTYQSSAFFFL